MDQQLQNLAARLYERRGEAVLVPFARRSMSNWEPQPKCCYQNVDLWIEQHPNCKAIRGWLVSIEEGFPVARFIPHSVIEEPDGTLVDITPTPVPLTRPFLRHEEGNEDFDDVVGDNMIIFLDHHL